MIFKYPAGVAPPKLRSDLHKRPKESVGPLATPDKKSILSAWEHHNNKYHAKKIHAYGHTFDSNVEYGFYLYLRFIEHVYFRVHVRFLIKPHHLTKSGISIRKRSYTPDFVRYHDKHDYIHHQPYEVDDVKGVKKIPSADSMKFGDFEDARDIPVVIIRWERHHWIRQKKCF